MGGQIDLLSEFCTLRVRSTGIHSAHTLIRVRLGEALREADTTPKPEFEISNAPLLVNLIFRGKCIPPSGVPRHEIVLRCVIGSPKYLGARQLFAAWFTR